MIDFTMFVYTPLEWESKLGYSVNPNRCRYSVHNSYGVRFHQCIRRPVEMIRGYGFCKQHAKKVRQYLEES